MTNQEMWPIGTRVRFNHDNLEAIGTIIVHRSNKSTVIVCIDENGSGGWGIDSYECPDMPTFYGRRGWLVPYTKLERCVTKLGNTL
jgi:hypothetical protein